MAKQYELTYTTSENLTPEEAGALFNKVSSFIPQTTSSDKGQDYFTIEFYAEPEMIAELDGKLKAEPQIKRYLITKKEAVRVLKTRTKKIPAEIPTPAGEKKVEKADLKEIDQKLKEIFGE